MSVSVHRLPGNPIVARSPGTAIGINVNGPSLIAAPLWLERPLGRYYLYFAHHRGRSIRLATADRLEGPWTLYEPGALQLERSGFPTTGRRPHIASPDVHVDAASRTVRMYYHGLLADRSQATRVALSTNGLHFEAQPELLGRPYMRVFRHDDGFWYGLAKPGVLSRSRDGLGAFERGPTVLERSTRHAAVLAHGGELLVFFSRIGDTPERILLSRVPLTGDWPRWRSGTAEVVLEPELSWEGGDLALEPSEPGWSDVPVRQLRDPAVYQEAGRTYLLYGVAGESGIAIAELDLEAPEPARTVAPLSPDAVTPARRGERVRESSVRVLAYVNRAHGSQYELVELIARDRRSASALVQAPDGARLVLSWHRDPATASQLRQAAAVIDAARARGWPTPQWLAVGVTPSGFPYRVQELPCGDRAERITAEVARAALAVIDGQAGQRPHTDRDWSAHDRRITFEDEQAFASRVAGFSSAGRALVASLAAWAAPHRSLPLPDADLVHGSLGPHAIILDREGRIEAFGHAETVGRGSRLHDVASLVAHATLGGGDRDAQELLLDHAARHATAGELEVSLAACLLSLVAREIEGDPDGGDAAITTAAGLVTRLADRASPA